MSPSQEVPVRCNAVSAILIKGEGGRRPSRLRKNRGLMAEPGDVERRLASFGPSGWSEGVFTGCYERIMVPASPFRRLLGAIRQGEVTQPGSTGYPLVGSPSAWPFAPGCRPWLPDAPPGWSGPALDSAYGGTPPTVFIHPKISSTRLRALWLRAYPACRVVRPSMALDLPDVFCATWGVTRRCRIAATHSRVS